MLDQYRLVFDKWLFRVTERLRYGRVRTKKGGFYVGQQCNINGRQGVCIVATEECIVVLGRDVETGLVDYTQFAP